MQVTIKYPMLRQMGWLRLRFGRLACAGWRGAAAVLPVLPLR